MNTQKIQKDVYKIYLDEPESPTYTVYSKKVADELIDRLLLKYGKQFSVVLKKVEVPQ